MNKILTSLTLLAGLGLASLAPQAQAGNRYEEHNRHGYVQDYNHGKQHAYRKGYRDAKRDARKHRRARRHHRYCQYPRYDRYRQHNRHHDTHGRVGYRHDGDWRVVFKF